MFSNYIIIIIMHKMKWTWSSGIDKIPSSNAWSNSELGNIPPSLTMPASFPYVSLMQNSNVMCTYNNEHTNHLHPQEWTDCEHHKLPGGQ